MCIFKVCFHFYLGVVRICWRSEVTPRLLVGAEPDAHQFNVTICLNGDQMEEDSKQHRVNSETRPGMHDEWGLDKLQTVSRSKGWIDEDLCKKGARSITYIRCVTDWGRMHSNAKSFHIQIQIPKGTTTPQQILYCNKMFDCESSSVRWKKYGKRKIVCYKTRNLKHRGITRKPEYLLNLYSQELSSTIDRYQNGKNAYIYSKQQ